MKKPAASVDTGKAWFKQAGGVLPAYVTAASSNRYLSMAEREDIHAGIERGDSLRCIAKSLGRAPSTVYRELRRNMTQRYRAQAQEPPGGPRNLPLDYRPSLAQRRADAKACRPSVRFRSVRV